VCKSIKKYKKKGKADEVEKPEKARTENEEMKTR
jgi:hypothetical protein